MKILSLPAAALAAAFLGLATLPAQIAPPRARVSPHETISSRIDGNRVTIVYGRPYSKDPKTGSVRKIWGELVPFDKVWRLGADEATLLVTQQPIELGGAQLPAGAYSLYLLPAADGSAKLLVNKLIGQWGADPYDEIKEFARVGLKKDPLDAPLDQFVMSIEKGPSGGGVIKLGWENTQYSVAFTVKK
jgi:hypothetical protein